MSKKKGWNMVHDRFDSAGEERRTGLTGAADRRTLLKGLSFAGLAAGSVALPSAPAEPADVNPQGASYRETDHIRKYYDLARS